MTRVQRWKKKVAKLDKKFKAAEKKMMKLEKVLDAATRQYNALKVDEKRK